MKQTNETTGIDILMGEGEITQQENEEEII